MMETEFSLDLPDLTVKCILTLPEGRVQRIVVGVHGIGGSSRDAIQNALAEEMSLFDSAVFRFDLPGHGQSPTDELTLAGCTASLTAVAREARRRFPEVEDLCIFASGFGAYVTLVSIDQLLALPGRLKLVVQTPSVRMDLTILAMCGLTAETLWTMDSFTLRSPRPLKISYRFFEELVDHFAVNTYPVPMLILHGEEDSFIRMADVRVLRDKNEQSKLVIIPGTSHRFLESGAWDMVVDLTRDWFEFEQVLMSDWE